MAQKTSGCEKSCSILFLVSLDFILRFFFFLSFDLKNERLLLFDTMIAWAAGTGAGMENGSNEV